VEKGKKGKKKLEEKRKITSLEQNCDGVGGETVDPKKLEERKATGGRKKTKERGSFY